MNRDKSALPHGWEVVPLQDVCEILDSMRIPVNVSERNTRIEGKNLDELYPYYGATGQVGWIDDFIFNGDFVLIGEDGAPFLDPFKEKAYVAKGKFWVNNHAHIVKAYVSNNFLKYYLNQVDYSDHVTGTTRLKLNQSKLRNIEVAFPPENEQHRIVTKIEELFSELDAGVAELERVRAQLKRYRQALLKAAFEGRLTEQWRRARAVELEPADVLLSRIRVQRWSRWQQQLAAWEQAVAEWEAAGKPGKKPRKPRKPKELPPLTEKELAELPELPEGWAWVRLGEIAEILGGVTKGRKLDGKKTIELPYLRVANVQDGYLDLSVVKEIEVLPEDLAKYRLVPGDILYTEGGDKDKLGRGTVWEGQIENCIHQNHVFRARVSNEFFNSKYVAYYSQTQTAKRYFFRQGKQTTNLASINMTVLSNLPLPLIPKQEQEEVIAKLETYLSTVEYLDQTIDQSLQQAAALRQAILKKAFSGQLVPQDPGDEPAAVLLERIRAEKEKNLVTNKKTPRRRRT